MFTAIPAGNSVESVFRQASEIIPSEPKITGKNIP
jgi:hypothetical protein